MALFLCSFLVVLQGADVLHTEQIAITPLQDQSFLTLESRWPRTTRLPWRVGEGLKEPPEQSYQLAISQRVAANQHDAHDTYSAVSLRKDGYQWAYFHAALSTEFNAAATALGDREKILLNTKSSQKAAKTANDDAIEEVVAFWKAELKARVQKHLEEEFGKKINIHLTHDDEDEVVKEIWEEAGKPLKRHGGVVARSSDAGALTQLHIESNIFSSELKAAADVARSKGFEDYNVWIAFSDVKKSPLVLLPSAKIDLEKNTIDIGDAVLHMSEMKAGDYVIFSTDSIAHAGSRAVDSEDVTFYDSMCDFLTSVCLPWGDSLIDRVSEKEIFEKFKNGDNGGRLSADFRVWVDFVKED